AFEILKDSSWGPVKLYRTTRFDTAGTTLRLQGGALDPVTGQSYHQLAMAGRSRHRSQDMGQLQRPGPSVIRLGLIETRAGGRGERVERGGLDDPARRPRSGGPAGVGGGAARRRGLTRRPRGGRDAPLRRHRGPGRPALATLLPAPSARGSLVRLDGRARRLA